MKLLALIAMMVFFVSMSAGAVLIGRNVIQNGSFENRPGGEGEDPRGWSSWNSEYNGLATNEFRSGAQAACLVCPKTGDSNGIFFSYSEVKPGNKYIFSCYAKNFSKEPLKGDVVGQLSIEWLKRDKDKEGKDILAEISRDWGPKFGPELSVMKWEPFTMTATAPADADSCRFTIQFFNNGGGGGKFFVEDASAEELNPFFKDKDTYNTTESLSSAAAFKTVSSLMKVKMAVDGEFDEWKIIEPLADDSIKDVDETEPINFSKVWATPVGKNLYISYRCTKPINFEDSAYRYNIFIDADNNAGTGYKGWDGNWVLGADYLIQGATIFEFSAATNRTWGWKKREVLAYKIGGDQVEMRILLSFLGLENKRECRILFYGDNINEIDYVPDDHLNKSFVIEIK